MYNMFASQLFYFGAVTKSWLYLPPVSFIWNVCLLTEMHLWTERTTKTNQIHCKFISHTGYPETCILFGDSEPLHRFLKKAPWLVLKENKEEVRVPITLMGWAPAWTEKETHMSNI